MTGLIPSMARRLGIPCLFTVHNIHTQEMTLEYIEDTGVDAAEFWKYLYFKWPPSNYEDSRSSNPVDLLCSGIFAAHFVNTVSPTFLREVVEGRHGFIPPHIRYQFECKYNAECAVGILNAPDPEYNPSTDPALVQTYAAETHTEGKQRNKLAFQEKLGLTVDADAPLFFWPSRLDPAQKGPQLLTDILYATMDKYWSTGLQLAVVANGAYQRVFHEIVHFHGFHDRVAVVDFEEQLSHLGYAAADFMLMPSLFEPCGLPQMISQKYGTLPVVHDTGGLHDTVSPLDVASHSGNGFVFETYDGSGLAWAVDRAIEFHHLPGPVKAAETARIMREAEASFNHSVTAQEYIDIYEMMLQRPLVNDM
jgi:ADP-glucose type glycogen/starch synthase